MEQLALGNESRSPDGLTPKQVLDKMVQYKKITKEKEDEILSKE